MTGAQDPFSRLVVALEPWLNQLVIIGGWAHRLYRQHPAAQELDYPPLTTLDTDIAMPLKLSAREQDVRSRLLAQGFAEELLGDDRPPATHYHLGDDASGFYAEFLTPLTGSDYDRKGRRRVTTEVSGVTSQRLHHLDIVLHHPWFIDFTSGEFKARVHIANPVSFVAQKILIHKQRAREDRAKDILYIHDTIEVFGANLNQLREIWQGLVAPELHSRDARIVSRASKDLFGTLSDDIRRAAQIPDQRGLSPPQIREACQYGLIQIFGS
jgi:hypothetical protein